MPTGDPKASELRCPKCDYCLTGLPMNRCPECGQEFNPSELRANMEVLKHVQHGAIFVAAGWAIIFFGIFSIQPTVEAVCFLMAIVVLVGTLIRYPTSWLIRVTAIAGVGLSLYGAVVDIRMLLGKG